ncbi:hypothetical protein [Luethyella okanaganae]|uniref:Uncharacterized protein n=1 Tax=Luethyella okanaganae TaxID=69372 RepID=A0ABW1VIN7_9MICO
MTNDRHQQEFGQMPGMNGSPLGQSFSDGPAKKPRRIRWWEPVATIIAFAAVLITIILFTSQ